MGGTANRKLAFVVGAAAGAMALHGTGRASETISYTFDALGRLTGVSTSGGPNDGVNVSTAYDPAGNRSNYTVGSGGTPPPPPGNNPPVADDDYLLLVEWESGLINVVANDSDPDGDSISLVSISDPSGYAYQASSTSIGWTGSPAGSYGVGYTIQDSQGATATGSLWVDVTQDCGTNICE